MKTSYAFIAFGVSILLYVWAAISLHSLSLYSNKPSILSGLVVALFFLVIGIISLIFHAS